MNKLHELIKEKLHHWPAGYDLICVSRKNQWMFRHEQSDEQESLDRTIEALGPCSSIYRGLSCTEVQYLRLRKESVMSEELKPCPFCGSQAGRATKKSTAFSSPMRVACSNDGCGAHYGYWHPKEWNNRSELAALKAGQGEAVAMRLHLGDDALWLQLECAGKHAAINLDSIRPARWFAEAYRAATPSAKKESGDE